MDNGHFDAKDLSLLMAVKPFLTPQGQRTLDGVFQLLEIFAMPTTATAGLQEKPDSQALAALIRLLNE